MAGAVLASFAGAMAWRVRQRLPVGLRARSQCEACGHPLAARDLVPLVSWLLLRARCRYCAAPIGLRHPLAELAGGLAGLLLYVWAR